MGSVSLACSLKWHLLGMGFCKGVLLQTWIVMVVVAGLSLLAARGAASGKPSRMQNLFEMLVEFIGGFIGGTVTDLAQQRKQRFLFEFLAALFLFVFVSNLLDVIPPYTAPTNTLNTTLALAVIVFVFTHVSGLSRHKGKYGKTFIHGGAAGYFLLPLTIIEELSKPLTLSFRLFGNIFAGELMIAVLASLMGGLRLAFGGFIPQVAWLAFSIFVAAVQAFIFTILALAYRNQAAEEEH